ncbi:MAG: D-aminoacyl-tRNA deacylase [Mobiluncus sp.]|uniref:D-aminoacyl-tRNA deacylase n=1 Tax=Mobiluncus sp. TaxID=47293 RepID=UPI002591020F|nr:D-aminoacyl-tRNA deacylase [Mobiluncus sp.]MCI6584651.1 D-aminoacyl-tRNA deacylase [Mobiluncus sp.]
MRAVIQRANSASCTVEGRVAGEFTGPGLVVFIGVTGTDGAAEVETMVRKIANLRVFDAPGAYDAAVAGSEKLAEARGNEVSALTLGLPVLVISQFTIYGDARKGNRPSWIQAASGKVAEPLVEAVCVGLEALGVRVERGIFGADMKVSLVNDGPFTILLDI